MVLLKTISTAAAKIISEQGEMATNKRPNLLIIVADGLSFLRNLPLAALSLTLFSPDLGYSDVGCYGSEIHTPNINRLAEEGVLFTDCKVIRASSFIAAPYFAALTPASL